MISKKPHYSYIAMRFNNVILHKRFSLKDLKKQLKLMFKQNIIFEELQPQHDNTLLVKITFQKVEYEILINYLYDLKNNLFITGFETR